MHLMIRDNESEDESDNESEKERVMMSEMSLMM